MNVDELRRLASWYIDHYANLHSLYNKLLSPVQHNASQPNKQPLEGQLEALIDYLRSMRFEELSLQQLKLLYDLGVDQYIGSEGANFIEATIRTSDYDPSTASSKISEAIGVLNNVNSGFSSYRDSIQSLGLSAPDDQEEDDFITIRVGFQNEAAIDNVTDWRDSAKDWYDIVRGLALASNEAPEDTRIVGASTGSIILILAGTLSVTTLLALISKNIAAVAKDVIGIGNQIEDLRRKKMLNGVIEKELRKLEKDKKDKAQADIIALISNKIPDLDGEKITALEGSIKKLLAFNEKGGNVDFVAPEEGAGDEDNDNADGEAATSALEAARSAIHDYQEVREQIKLLTDLSQQS